MKKVLEVTSIIHLDDLRYNLQTNLSVNQLVDFAIGLSENLTDDREYLLTLKKKLDKLNLDVE